jgi:hypothetical protein
MVFMGAVSIGAAAVWLTFASADVVGIGLTLGTGVGLGARAA